jgi:hypothetical protein
VLEFRVPKGKLAVVLLVSKNDTKDCCAQNYERTVFRSPTVVKYAKDHLIAYRFDRDTGTGKDLVDKYKLETVKPAILVLDWDGELLYKTQRCVNPGDCLLGLKYAAGLTAKRVAYEKTATKKLGEVDDLVKSAEFDRAIATLEGLKADMLLLSQRRKADELRDGIAATGREKLEQARGLEGEKQFDRAAEIYRDIARGFKRIDSIEKEAKEALIRVKRLQEAS